MEEIEFKPALWYMVTFVVGTALVCIVLKLLWASFPTAVILGAPLGGAVGVNMTQSLKISPAGVEVARRTASWDALVLHRGRWGESLRTSPGSVPRTQQVNAFLPMYEANWRQGQIGRSVATWAPQLLDQTDDAP